jgi:hypothetical protein
MKRKILVTIVVTVLVMLVFVSIAAAKKPPNPGKPWEWEPTHYANFTGDLYNSEDQERRVEDARVYIHSDIQQNDFELDFVGDFPEECHTPAEGVLGYLSIEKPGKKHELAIRYNWLDDVGGSIRSINMLCAGGTFTEDGDGYDIVHTGNCTILIGNEPLCSADVSFEIDIVPIP